MSENQEKDNKWFFLSHIMPDANELDKSKRKDLYGLVRRTIIKEQEVKEEALQVFRLDDYQSLKDMIKIVPFASDEEIIEQVNELQLPQEEAEIEISSWPFNHQSVRGDLISGDDLLPFKLVRLFEYTYLLLCRENRPEVATAFAKAFETDYGVFSGEALNIDDDKWCGWAWFIDPDSVKRHDQATQLKEIWGRLNHKL